MLIVYYLYMKLTVVMSVKNNQDTLKEAIDSILNQTYSGYKFIIVDDASTDDSSVILRQASLKDKRIQIISNQKSLGLTKSLNQALKKTNTKYIARMDADDISLPKRLKLQFDYLESHPKIALLGTAAFLINRYGKKIKLKRYPSDYQQLRNLILHFCPFIHPTLMIRLKVLKKLGFYNPQFPFAQDYDLALRLLIKHQAANLPQPLIKYRVDSPQAISSKHLKTQERLAIKARFRALTTYNYPKQESWKLIKPMLSFLVPSKIKTRIYQQTFFK